MDVVTLAMAKRYIDQNYGNRFVRALGHRLTSGVEPACALAFGDSTSDGATEWFVAAMEYLAAFYPAYTVNLRTWNETTTSYEHTIVPSQTGGDGIAYIGYTGNGNDKISTPDSVALSIGGDFEISMKIAMDDWTPAVSKVLAMKWGPAGDRSWEIVLDATNLYFYWTANGTDALESHVAAPAVTDGAAKYLKITMDVDNGAGGNTVAFYTSDDGITWMQLGTSQTKAGTTSIFDSASAVEIWPGGTGKFYSAIIRNGIGGPIVASPDANMAFPSTISTFKDMQGNVWTKASNGENTFGNGSPGLLLLNGSQGGASISYGADETRFAILTGYEPQLVFINYGHNEPASAGYQAAYEAFCTQILTKWPNAGVVCVTQNPQTTPRSAAQIALQDLCQQQVVLAAIKNDYGLIDAYKAFVKTGNTAVYLAADGVHPNAIGSILWTNEAIKFLRPAI